MLKFSEKAISTLKSRELDDWNITDWIEIFLYRMRGYARLKMWSDLDVNVDVFLEHVKNPFLEG